MGGGQALADCASIIFGLIGGGGGGEGRRGRGRSGARPLLIVLANFFA